MSSSPSPPQPLPPRSDAVIIGAGPAGLSAALTLARFDRTVTVIDSGDGRSTFQQTNHNYLGFPDGISALKLRRLGRDQLTRYPKVSLVFAEVDHVEGDASDGFVTVCTDEQSIESRVIIIATGVRDNYPRFPDWESYVGRSMFWCITCDGYENRDRDVIVAGNDDIAAVEALQLRNLTDRVRLLTNSESSTVSEEVCLRLVASGIPVLHDRIVGVDGEDGLMTALHTAGGETLELQALFSVQGAEPRSALAEALGVKLSDGWIAVDTDQRTSMPGVYAAGDVTALHSHQVTVAIHEGSQAACAANYFLYPDRLKLD